MKSLQDPPEVGNNLPGISDNVRERAAGTEMFFKRRRKVDGDGADITLYEGADHCDERACLSASISSEIHARSSTNRLRFGLLTIVRVYKLYLLTYLLIIYVLRVTNGRGSVLFWRR